MVAEEGEREQERRLDDERDARWLAAGEHARLLATYFDLVRNLARVRARSDDEADEVTQAVMCKLMAELRAGKVYTAPFRAVVIQRTKWVQHDLWRARKRGREVPYDPERDESSSGEGPFEQVEAGLILRAMVELPERTRAVCELVFVGGLAPEAAAAELGMERNAVDQALHRGRKRLRELVDG